jgi:hypothetical protein
MEDLSLDIVRTWKRVVRGCMNTSSDQYSFEKLNTQRPTSCFVSRQKVHFSTVLGLFRCTYCVLRSTCVNDKSCCGAQLDMIAAQGQTPTC